MILDRLELLKAIGFLKHAISDKEESNGYNCLHVRFEKDKFILTAGNGFVTKKAILMRPITTEEMSRDDLDREKEDVKESPRFMIPLSTLSSFEKLISNHKKKAKKLAKNVQSFLYVEVEKNCLESFGVEIQYKQPAFQFLDFEGQFQIQQGAVVGSFINSKWMESAVKGFDGSTPVSVTYTGNKKPIHFYQDSTEFEAIMNQGNDPEKKE